MQGPPRRVRNACHPHPPDAQPILLGRDRHQRFANCTSSALCRACFLAADESFIHLHTAAKPVSARTDRGAPQLMHPDPGRLVAAEPQNLLQAHGAGTVLLAGHVPNGPKPHPQGLMRVLKDRSRSGRRLVTTTVADDPASRRRPTAAVLATRTKKSLRPPKLLQIRSTDLFRIESLLQFQDCPRIVLHARILDVGGGGVKGITMERFQAVN